MTDLAFNAKALLRSRTGVWRASGTGKRPSAARHGGVRALALLFAFGGAARAGKPEAAKEPGTTLDPSGGAAGAGNGAAGADGAAGQPGADGARAGRRRAPAGPGAPAAREAPEEPAEAGPVGAAPGGPGRSSGRRPIRGPGRPGPRGGASWRPARCGAGTTPAPCGPAGRWSCGAGPGGPATPRSGSTTARPTTRPATGGGASPTRRCRPGRRRSSPGPAGRSSSGAGRSRARWPGSATSSPTAPCTTRRRTPGSPWPTGRWRQRYGARAVWTGSRLVVWGGASAAGGEDPPPLADGAAYDPAENRWTKMAAAPLGGRIAPLGRRPGRVGAVLLGPGRVPGRPAGPRLRQRPLRPGPEPLVAGRPRSRPAQADVVPRPGGLRRGRHRQPGGLRRPGPGLGPVRRPVGRRSPTASSATPSSKGRPRRGRAAG